MSDLQTEAADRQARPSPTPDWRSDAGPVGYEQAIVTMEARVEAIAAGRQPELVWLLEHPALYTAGTSANDADLMQPPRLPVYRTGRGGQFTYHGPGQRVAYVMLDLKRRGGDLHAYVTGLEHWMIAALADLGVTAETRLGRVGVWVARGSGEDKIGAIGVRVRRGISYHGISLNVSPELSHFAGIVPCGIPEHGVTSLRDLGIDASMARLDNALRRHFEQQVLGRLR